MWTREVWCPIGWTEIELLRLYDDPVHDDRDHHDEEHAMKKKNVKDNRSRQLNPQHPTYWQSRGQTPKTSTSGGNSSKK